MREGFHSFFSFFRKLRAIAYSPRPTLPSWVASESIINAKVVHFGGKDLER